MMKQRDFRGYAAPLPVFAGQAFGGILLRLLAVAFMCWEYVAVWFVLSVAVMLPGIALGWPLEWSLLGLIASTVAVALLQETDRWMRFCARVSVALIALFAVPVVGMALMRHFHADAAPRFLTLAGVSAELVCYGLVGTALLLAGFFGLVKLSWWLVFRDSPAFPFHVPRS